MHPLNPVIYQSLVPANYTFDVIYDVGANVGQTFSRLRQNFPSSSIYSFEPISSTYDELKRTVDAENSPRFQAHCLAAGESEGVQRIYLKELNVQNTLTEGINKPRSADTAFVDVNVIRLDSFSQRHQLNHIDILKLDVEGYEIPALRGASEILERVSFVIAEVNFSLTDRRQSYYGEVDSLLRAYEFAPVGIYDVQYRARDGRLDYADAVFVNPNAIKRKMGVKVAINAPPPIQAKPTMLKRFIKSFR